MKTDLKDVLFLDCETTGLPAKGAKWDTDFAGFPHVVQLSWSCNGVEKDYIIYPDGWEIPGEATEIHGVTMEKALTEGVPFATVAAEFCADCAAARLLVGHNVYFDVSIIKANILRVCGKEWYDANADDALFKGKRIDTMMKTIKFVGVCFPNSTRCKFPKLEELYNKLFPGETFTAHNSLEDVRAVVRCVPKLVEQGIIELKVKEYPPEQLKANFEPGKGQKRGIEFADPNPVTEPIGTVPAPEPPTKTEPEKHNEALQRTQQLLDDNEF